MEARVGRVPITFAKLNKCSSDARLPCSSEACPRGSFAPGLAPFRRPNGVSFSAYPYKRHPFVGVQTEGPKPYKLTLVGFFSRTQRVPPLQGLITGSPNLGRCEFVSNRPPLAVLLDKLGRRGSGTCSYWFTGSNKGGAAAQEQPDRDGATWSGHVKIAPALPRGKAGTFKALLARRSLGVAGLALPQGRARSPKRVL
jgi:hypothetical protein